MLGVRIHLRARTYVCRRVSVSINPQTTKLFTVKINPRGGGGGSADKRSSFGMEAALD